MSKLSTATKSVMTEATEFLNKIVQSRASEGESILSFDFQKSRCRVLSRNDRVKENSAGILYWMLRDCRVQDNWALLFAQRLALKQELPLSVCFCVKDVSELYPTQRQFHFLIEGLKCVESECRELGIGFYVIDCSPPDLANLVKICNIGSVVCEFFPLRKPQSWKAALLSALPPDVSLVEVDAHNVVPAWLASEKQELAARTIRPKIQKKLPEFLTGFPRVCSHPHKGNLKIDSKLIVTLDQALLHFRPIEDVAEVSWATPGPTGGLTMLHTFINGKLKEYGDSDPSKDAVSHLSPWLHFGQISAQRCALEVENYKSKYKNQVEKFLEELIVRRELADNFCNYNDKYDCLKGADAWAVKTLNEHRKDKRTYIYTKEQFRDGLTHDEIWNCVQRQLLTDGKIHGYMRMYWCKKILEWTESPEKALEMAIYLNDTFSLDGSDPNGFVGVMWSICGVHDHGWKERDIFGKIRFMVDYSLRNKFDIDAYCEKFPSQGKTETGAALKRKEKSETKRTTKKRK